ncbi:MAG: LLM class flavin-dependent oxidoreductase [Bacteroidales bacterium]|nr:LLM class flavin-dependent oxidoreductase [Bacteroidales bacterium]
MKQPQLSILDLAYITEGDESPTHVLQNSTEVAQLADKLGYTRYWFAEHHNTGFLMSMFPEIMMAHVAANTQRIRVGSGGVMLPNHSALSVVERFSMLEALHPGRIDLGIGRAPGTDGRTAYALRRSWEVIKEDTFPDQLEALLGFFGHDLRSDHPFAAIQANPDPSLTPDIYMLGSSTGGVQFAVENGLAFVFAAQINAELAVPVLKMYREKFKPSKYYQEPKSIMSIGVFTAETEEEARYLAEPSLLMWTMLATGRRFKSFPSTRFAHDYHYSTQEKAIRQMQLNKFVIGTPERVAERLTELAKEAEIDEIIIADSYPEVGARKKAYELLAKELNL